MTPKPKPNGPSVPTMLDVPLCAPAGPDPGAAEPRTQRRPEHHAREAQAATGWDAPPPLAVRAPHAPGPRLGAANARPATAAQGGRDTSGP
eukprot:15464146-Alexandrium_andersonii.AAC.1